MKARLFFRTWPSEPLDLELPDTTAGSLGAELATSARWLRFDDGLEGPTWLIPKDNIAAIEIPEGQ